MSDWFSNIIWFVYSIALTIEFGRSLLKLHKFFVGLDKKGGFISHWKLMIVHFGALLMATLANSFTLIIESVRKFDDSIEKDSNLYMRLYITYNYLTILEYFAWFIVHIVMLRIFLTYGRAL